ncbi:MAG: cytochrome c family protein [Hyphomicrobiaceae bacterium]
MSGRRFRRIAELALISFFFAIPHAGDVEAADIAKQIAKADIEHGKSVALRCKACHTLDNGGRHVLGPNLWKIVGRGIGQVTDFTRYSDAIKKRGGKWDLANLDAFLESPKTWAPGTRMTFPGIPDEDDRIDLLAYLLTLNDVPPRQAATSQPPQSAPPAKRRSSIDYGGMPDGEGRDMVAVICGACHSLRTVTQQGLSQDRWDELMDWMVEKQGMAPLDSETRKAIVGYLTEHYGPSRRARGLQTTNPMMPAMPMMPSMAPPLPPPPPEEKK